MTASDLGSWSEFERLGLDELARGLAPDALELVTRVLVRAGDTLGTGDGVAALLELLLDCPVEMHQFQLRSHDVGAGRFGMPEGAVVGRNCLVGGVLADANEGVRIEVDATPTGRPEELAAAGWLERASSGSWTASSVLRALVELVAPIWLDFEWRILTGVQPSAPIVSGVGQARVGRSRIGLVESTSSPRAPTLQFAEALS